MDVKRHINMFMLYNKIKTIIVPTIETKIINSPKIIKDELFKTIVI
jgi:hypothetical protein